MTQKSNQQCYLNFINGNLGVVRLQLDRIGQMWPKQFAPFPDFIPTPLFLFQKAGKHIALTTDEKATKVKSMQWFEMMSPGF